MVFSCQMQVPEHHPREEERIALLRLCGVLDTAPDSDFDGLTQLASAIAGTPIALVSLIDETRQWFKAHHGLDATETPREYAFCAHAILDPEHPFVIPDAREDERFFDNPLVTSGPHVTFYAGVPLLVGPEKLPLGTLCVIDQKPHQIAPEKLEQLRLLARQVELLLEFRMHQRELEDHLLAKHESQRQISAIFSSMSEGLVVQRRDGAIESCNPAAERILGLTHDQLCGRTSLDPRWRAIREDGSPFPGAEHPAMVTLRTGEPVRDVVMGVGLDGEKRRWILINSIPSARGSGGLPERCVTTFADITRLREEEEERRRVEGQVDKFFSISLDLLCIAGMDGMFKRLNPAWNALLGWTEAELLGRPFIWFVHPDDVEATNAEAARLSSGGSTVQFENRYRCVDGTYRVMHWSVVGVPEDEVFIAVARDVTEERKAGEELKQTAAAAEAESKAKSAFLATMSHEIRTPLNGVLGLAELLALSPLEESQAEMVETIRNSGRLLLRVINDILDWSKIQAGRMDVFIENVSVSEVVREVLDSLRPTASRKRLQIVIDDDGGGVLVKADSQRLRQILTNLVGNAIKFTEQGSITVRILKQGSEQVQIEVLDSGIGISESDLPKLFTWFTQVSSGDARQFGGTGLGLAISLELAHAMNGNLHVNSELGKGSTFTLRLPRALQERQLPARKPTEGASLELPLDANRLRVLLAEDNMVNQMVALGMLRSLGHTVQVVLNGQEALDAALAQIDVVLMDVQMPVMDGLEATRQIRALEQKTSGRRIPIIALTASAMHEQRQACFDADMDGVLTKPVTRASLQNALSEAVRV
ncbi:MAG: ATP-binding protein [Verrucomicrobiota bacterium]